MNERVTVMMYAAPLMITMTLNCSLMIFSYELMIYVLKLNFDY